MKKWMALWVVVGLLIPAAAGAQQERIGLAVKIGVNHANMIVRNKETHQRLNTRPRNNPYFAAELEYQFAKLFSYIAGLSYLQQGYAVRISNPDYPYTYFRDFKYLGIIQKARITFHLSFFDLFTSIGVSGEALLSAHYQRNYDRNAKPSYSIDIKERYNSGMLIPEWDFGFGIPFGNWRISAEATYVIGGDDIAKPELVNLHTHTHKIHDSRYYLGLTYYLP